MTSLIKILFLVEEQLKIFYILAFLEGHKPKKLIFRL